MDEKELVIRAKRGDIDAFCILYDNYKRKLFNYAYYKLGNSEDDRNIVLLSVVVGLNSKEIAKITGFTAGNVRQRLSRSLSKMKRYLS